MAHSAQVLEKLQKIEDEMKRIGYWNDSLDDNRVKQKAIEFAQQHGKSPVGTMPFEDWLQAVFIPTARIQRSIGHGDAGIRLPFTRA